MELLTRLKTLATKWLAGCDSVIAVIEKIVMKQLLEVLPSDLRVWMCQWKLTTGDEGAVLADECTLVRRHKGADRKPRKEDDPWKTVTRTVGLDKKATTPHTVFTP